MRTESRVSTFRITRCALFICAALLCSYLESLIPLGVVLPLPGFRLGLANIVIMIVFFAVSPAEAWIASAARVLVTALLFGNPVSFFFSASGALLSLLGMAALRRLLRGRVSFIGVSMLGAALHNTGQICAAMLIFGYGVISYLPVLLVASVALGAVCGWTVCLVYPKITIVLKRKAR